jgi:5-(aminomethyl)-3-furanmethanol phosphate kinase
VSRRSPISVIKVGGSLLNRPDLSGSLGSYLASNADQRSVFVVGGGVMADHLRSLDRIHSLGEAKSHALALAILEVTAQLLAALLPSTRVAHSLADLSTTWSARLTPILTPHNLLNTDEFLSEAGVLTQTWSVTTDSISARLAVLLGAESLILLKSGVEPPGLTIRTSSALGLTDPVFPEYSRKIGRVEYYTFPPLTVAETTFQPIAPHLLSW